MQDFPGALNAGAQVPSLVRELDCTCRTLRVHMSQLKRKKGPDPLQSQAPYSTMKTEGPVGSSQDSVQPNKQMLKKRKKKKNKMRFFGWCPCPGSNTHWKDKFLPKPGIFKLFCERHMAERRPRSQQSLFFMYPQPRGRLDLAALLQPQTYSKDGRWCTQHQATEHPAFPADSPLPALMKKLPGCRGPHHKD